MHYRFLEFDFDSTSLLLTTKGETVAIRHNEAKVLALLLEHTGKVLSKENILSNVWQNKIVSEQAIFQNISHLRAFFGNDAIKTFPKRGYQWQLKTECISEVTEAASGAHGSIQTLQHTPHQPSEFYKKPAYKLFAALAGILLIISIINLPTGGEQQDTDSIIKIAFIPLSNPQESTSITLDDNLHFDFTALTHLDTAHFEVSAELEYLSLANTHPFVLTGQIRTFDQQTYLDFLLKGPFADWQGQLSGSSNDAVMAQLQNHLKQNFIYDLLSKPQPPELKQANLSIAHQQAPTDLITLGQLINIYLNTDELEKAMVMADKLANIARTQNNFQQLGNALLYQSTILTGKELYGLSAQKLNLAIEQFEKIDDLKRQADAWNAQSWLDHQLGDYAAIKTSLLKSAQLAFDAKDKSRELHALTYLSVMAHKHHQELDKYLYLQQAENKMKAYQLPIYHFAKVPFHYAIFANNPADKEPHLKQVLEFTALTPDHWVAQSSREQLLQHYIEQNRLVEAQTLVASVSSDNAQNSYLKTLLAKAKQQTDEFTMHAKRTFEQAHLAGYRSLSLDVALLLCSTQNPQINYDFYSQYINENATKYWRRANESRLIALNL